MIEVIYVIRHAFRTNWTVNPTTGEYTSSSKTPTGIPTDPALSSYGVEQAKELAEYLCKTKPPIDRIYSSPFYRCLQTLKPATERLFAEGKAGGKVRVDRGIGEFFGLAHFEHPSPPSLSILAPHFPHLDHAHESTHIPHARGERILELHDRVEKALTTIITEMDADAEQPKALLICTHAATMIAIGRMLTGNMPEDVDDDDFQCFTASLSRFERRSKGDGEEDGVLGKWECVLNGETSYLSGGAERGWKFNGEESFVSFEEPTMKSESPKL